MFLPAMPPSCRRLDWLLPTCSEPACVCLPVLLSCVSLPRELAGGLDSATMSFWPSWAPISPELGLYVQPTALETSVKKRCNGGRTWWKQARAKEGVEGHRWCDVVPEDR